VHVCSPQVDDGHRGSLGLAGAPRGIRDVGPRQRSHGARAPRLRGATRSTTPAFSSAGC
jgi:hypothetical protein